MPIRSRQADKRKVHSNYSTSRRGTWNDTEKEEETELSIFSAEYRYNEEIKGDFEKWNDRREFEKSADYDKRLQEYSKAVFDSICYSVISHEIKHNNWKMRLDTYDADKEEFPIICTFDDVIARIRYKVPIDMAKEFKENFNHDEFYGKGQMWEALLRCDNFVYVTVPDRPDDNELYPSTILFSLTPYVNRDRGTVRGDFFNNADSIKVTFTSKAKPVAVRFNDLGLDNKYLANYVYVFKKGDNDIYSKKEQNEKESKSKEEQNESGSNKIFNGDDVDQQPSFPGGTNALNTFIASNLKYPIAAAENGIQRRVIVKFIVEKDGSISNVEVDRSVDPSLDNEAMRVVKAMPKWIPGQINGKAVKVECSHPFVFRLQ
ncbi:energy transducer TonB [Prevotella sp.]|uniref:energy transducer TonB n=1 Tax=Prevotella sp. TaxID=59823 RepID=UPI0027E27482|nr:TonB family protein [Prevotella sp.]